MSTLQKKYAAMVEEEERDQDGYWIYLKPGFWMPGDCHTIHEDTKTEARRRLREVVPCPCKDCAGRPLPANEFR
jgi:hypothetical protein